MRILVNNSSASKKILLKELSKLESKALKESSERLLNDLIENTPIDTGAARKGWNLEVKSNNLIEISNNVEYIESLNSGHSKQAPAFFVEKTALMYGTPNGVIIEP